MRVKKKSFRRKQAVSTAIAVVAVIVALLIGVGIGFAVAPAVLPAVGAGAKGPSGEIPIGAITYAVMSRMDGEEGTVIGAGIAWAWEKEGKFGLVAEAHGYMEEKALKEILEWKIEEMAKIREIELGRIEYRMENMVVPMDHYGCVLAVLVYLF